MHNASDKEYLKELRVSKREMKMQEKNNMATTTILFFLVVASIFIGITVVSSDVFGDVNNDTTIVKVNVTNSAPNITLIVAPTTVDLTPGNKTIVNCTAIVYDYNGWADVNHTNATLYDENYGMGDGSTFDNNFRYRNLTCPCVQYHGSTYNASCQCLFLVEYYANNGSWQCNITAGDDYGLTDVDNKTITINQVIGIESPTEIDYGNLSVTEQSDEKEANISNIGNVPINVSVRGYGGTANRKNPNNMTMNCATGNISFEYHKYSLVSGTAFSSMTKLSNTTTTISGFALYQRTYDVARGNDTNATYWKLEIPNGVTGDCNGSIEFFATQRN